MLFLGIVIFFGVFEGLSGYKEDGRAVMTTTHLSKSLSITSC